MIDYKNAFFDTPNKIQGLIDTSTIGSAQKVSESDNYGFWDGTMDTMKSTLSYAGTGAALGSAVPVIGTAVGAGIGAVVGLGMGIWDAFSSDSEDEKRQQAAREYNATVEAQRQQQIAIANNKNAQVRESYNTQNKQDTLSNYNNAVSAAKSYSVI